jgi:outer membrane cobalamin receptor
MRFERRVSTGIAALIVLMSPLDSPAQLSTGVVRGSIPVAVTRIVSPIHITLEEVSTSSLLASTVPDADGSFVFRNVPFATYDVTAFVGDLPVFQQRFGLHSTVPFTVFFDSTRHYQAPEIVIEGVPRLQERSAGNASTHSMYTAESIASLPNASAVKSIETVLLNTPGVVPDEDGRLHVRGEDAQLQYVVDGIPITGNLTRVYSSLFNAALVRSADVQTGALDPEYGVATSGVLAITTKSGFDRPFFAHVMGSGGSFSSREGFLELGGNLDGGAAIYLAGSTSSSDRYLDPMTQGSALHDGGNTRSLFGKLTALLGDDIDVTMLGMTNTTGYSIPNSLSKTPPQDQRQDLSDHLVGLRLSVILGADALLSAMGFTRRSTARITSGGILQLSSPAEYTLAIAENEKMFIGGDRQYTVTGGQVELSARGAWFAADHALKAGLGAESTPIHEFFTFAVTNPSLADTATPGGDERYTKYDITRGGRPFLVDRSRAGRRISAFVQDEVRFGQWTISGGVRYDAFSILEDESAFSPRLAAAFALDGRMTLRASYNRIVMQAPLENYLVSSSPEAGSLVGAEQGGIPTHVKSERAHVFEIGVARRMSRELDIDLAGYAKLIDNFIVNVELGNSGVIFPVNLKQGIVAGGELRLRLREWNNFSGFLSFSTCVSRGLVPDDGSSPFAAGLVLGEEGENYSKPFKGEDSFPTEHNQLLTAAFGLTYRTRFGLAATFGGRFDSGLPFDLTGPGGQALDESGSRAELLRRGYAPSVLGLLDLAPETAGSPDRALAPHAVFDAALIYDLRDVSSVPVKLSMTVLNIFDTPYLYKFESTFGGTHFGIPRTVSARLDVEY